MYVYCDKINNELVIDQNKKHVFIHFLNTDKNIKINFRVYVKSLEYGSTDFFLFCS